MDYLMAIDLGSTSLKAAIFDADGHCVASASRPTEKVHPSAEHPEWVTWDPEQIWGGAAASAKEAISKLDDPTLLRAVSVTGMGMDGVPIDAAGQVLYPFISWHCPRTAPQADWWKANIGAERTFGTTGFPVWPFMAAMRMLWMKQHEPAIFARIDKWLFIEDFLNWKLCDSRCTDFSMASCTELLDQKRRTWSEDLLSVSGIPRSILPELKSSGTRIGSVTAAASAKTGIPVGTPVVLGGQDHLCGTLPVGAYKPGTVMNVLGTWDSVITAVEQPVLTPAVRNAAVCMQAHVAPAVYAAWCGTVAGESLEWYRRLFGANQTWDSLLHELDGVQAGAGGVIYLPHISGAMCPIDDKQSLGAFTGITPATHRADLLKAIIEGLNFQFLEILQALQAGLGTSFKRITTGGGGAKNAFLLQNKADITGLVVEVPEITDATCQGAAMIAGIGAGVYASLDEACERVRRPGKSYQPRPELAAAYADHFKIYRELYPALKPVNHQLHSRQTAQPK